ncbi:MAG: 2-succinyl-6-hydroxy-2,4-cyclohexadiene-carboxylate synthase [Ilumatobacteraceae bacterium]|jgi:2-succinyl-6-hydroxy-2,4-cyclohexadiene-1-carboxylate synthase
MSDWRPLEGRLAGWTCGEGPRLVFVHGFTQTSQSWKPIAARFAAEGYEAVVVDAPGHADSTNIRADLRRGADMLTALCGLGVYIGYSLGGRLAMHAALMYPHLVRGLAVIGASPGIADESERAVRRADDNKLADHIVDVGVDAFLDEWLAQPLFAGMEIDDEQRADRLRNTAEGLASSLRHAGAGAQGSLWPRLREMNMPVLTIAGELDLKFAAIGRQIAASVPEGRSVEVPGVGHAAHLQDPEHVMGLLTTWLDEIKY